MFLFSVKYIREVSKLYLKKNKYNLITKTAKRGNPT